MPGFRNRIELSLLQKRNEREERNNNLEIYFHSVHELGENILKSGYSVKDKESIRSQYEKQVEQYLLYRQWFTKTLDLVREQQKPLRILEYGPGPGFLAKQLVNEQNVSEYTAVEPNETFCEMIEEATKGRAKIVQSTGEQYRNPQAFDIIVATATYHHFPDKVLSLKNAHENLVPDGLFIVADGFLPKYRFDRLYQPIDRAEFVNSVLRYASAQVLAMPSPSQAEVIDQMKTAFLDTIRVEEYKVCISILQDQLQKLGFTNIHTQLMEGEPSPRFNYHDLGYYFVTADKIR